jgi:hypothetical protein
VKIQSTQQYKNKNFTPKFDKILGCYSLPSYVQASPADGTKLAFKKKMFSSFLHMSIRADTSVTSSQLETSPF